MDAIKTKWLNRTVLTLTLGCAAFLGVACGDDDPPPDGGSTIDCGGLTGMPCPAGMYCNYPGNHCGQGDALGKCEALPTSCEQECLQVCGCDARSYCNACLAHMAGVDDSDMTCDDVPPSSKGQ